MGINLHTTTRIPVNDEYSAVLGKAVYIFAYYEWTIIYIIEHLNSGFVTQYSRPLKKPITSGALKQKLELVIDLTTFPINGLSREQLEECCSNFEALVVQRNALIHAHPITDKDGSQILSYQTNSSNRISDKKWPINEVESFIQEIDTAAISAGKILEKLRTKV